MLPGGLADAAKPPNGRAKHCQNTAIPMTKHAKTMTKPCHHTAIFGQTLPYGRPPSHPSPVEEGRGEGGAAREEVHACEPPDRSPAPLVHSSAVNYTTNAG